MKFIIDCQSILKDNWTRPVRWHEFFRSDLYCTPKIFFGFVFCTSILVIQRGEEVLRLQRKWSHCTRVDLNLAWSSFERHIKLDPKCLTHFRTRPMTSSKSRWWPLLIISQWAPIAQVLGIYPQTFLHFLPNFAIFDDSTELWKNHQNLAKN